MLRYCIFILLVMGIINLKGQNCGFTITVPQDITICEETDIVLNGNISGSYFGFEWSGTDGFFDDADLTPTVSVSQTTTYTLKVFSNPTTNLIVNGDFSGGNSGFSTQYTYMPDLPGSTTELWNEGTYSVGSNPNSVHTNFDPCTDHTGGGNMMIVNGAASLAQVWCQTVTVLPNTTYIFQAFAASVENSSPAILQFSINGVLIGSTVNLSSSTCVWEEFYETWDSGTNTSIQICITNQNTEPSGNDFALDDIFFGALCKDQKEFTVTLSEFDLLPPTNLYLDCNHPIGNLQVTAVPIVSGYTYTWSTANGNITSPTNINNINVNEEGQYIVTVTNAFGCDEELEYNVTADFSQPEVTIDGNLILDCKNKNTVLYGDSDVSNIAFTWTLPNGTTTNTSQILANTPGTYLLTGVALNGCMDTATTIVVFENANFKYGADSSGTITCANKTVQINLDIQSPIDSIKWTGSGVVSTNKAMDSIVVNSTGTYVYELFLGQDCSIKDSVKITETLPNFNYNLSVPDTLSCNKLNTSIVLQNGGNYQRQWYFEGQNIGSSDSINVVKIGDYLLELTDANGCKANDTIHVNGDYLTPQFTATIDSIDCVLNYGQFFVNYSQPATYLWQGQGQTSTDKNPIFTIEGDYNLTVTGENGCTITETYYLPSSKDFPIISAKIENISCKNPMGYIIIESNIPTNVKWNASNGQNGTNSSILTYVPGTYIVEATANNGCKSTQEFVITIDTIAPNLAPLGTDQLTCNTTTVSPNVNADTYTYFKWSGNGVFDDTNLERVFDKPGVYTLTLINDNGCETKEIYSVVENKKKPSISATANDITCKNPETKLIITGEPNLTFQFNHASIGLINGNAITVPGSVNIKATNDLGCDTTITINIIGHLDKPTIQAQPISINCKNPQAWTKDQYFDPNLKYEWISSAGSTAVDSILITSSTPSLTLVATNDYGCTSLSPVVVSSDFTVPTLSFEGDSIIQCNESSTAIKAVTNAPQNSIEWTENGNSISALQDITFTKPGTYVAIITNLTNGCKQQKSVEITAQESPKSIEFEVVQPLCFGEKGNINWSQVIGGQGPYLVKVNDKIVAQNSDYPVVGGKYNIEIKDVNLCTLTDEFEIFVPNDFSVNAGKDTTIQRNESCVLNAKSDLPFSAIKSIMWEPANSLSCDNCLKPRAFPDHDTEYTITIYDENGCIRTDRVWVRVKFEKGYIAPNIFNPDGNSNSKFTIYPFKSSILGIKTFKIYDRWGNLVFTTEDIPAGDPVYGWNGKTENRDMVVGVYVWVAEIEYVDNTFETVAGDVTLVR